MSSWRDWPLDLLATVAVSTVDKKQYEGETPVRLCNYTDVYYNDFVTAEIDFMEATATTDQIERFSVRAGDVVITKDSETSDDIGRPAFAPRDLPGVVYGYHLAVYRPLDRRYGRFLKYAFDSTSTRAELSRRTPGVTRVGLSQDTLRNLRIPAPRADEAQQIADYLDHETAEIDDFIADLTMARNITTERFTALRAAMMSAIRGSTPQLRRFVEYVTSGSRGWSDLLGEKGEPFVRITNIARDSLTLQMSELKRVDGVDQGEGTRARIEIGDVLMSITADLGSVGVAGVDVAGGYTSQHVALIRPSRALCSPRFLAHALLAPSTKAQIAEKSYGGTKIQLSLADVRELLVPLPSLENQECVVAELDCAQESRDQQLADIDAAIALAKERRAALITAAVTGQIDVTTKQLPAVDSIQTDIEEAR